MKIKLMITSLILLVGCTPVSSEPPPKYETVKLDVEPVYTYDGFYQEWDFSDEDQAKLDSGYLHISDAHLAATSEYNLPSYPLEGTTTNKYLEKYTKEINEFLENEFKKQLNNKLEIDIREDRLYDYQEKQNKNGVDKGILSYRFDVLGYEEYPAFYNEVEIDRDLLATKTVEDDFDVNILKIKERDGWFGEDWYGTGWYNDFVLMNILDMYYEDQITKYYSDLAEEINNYLDSTGNYYNYTREEVCPSSWLAAACGYTGNVSIYFGLSQKGEEYEDGLPEAEREAFSISVSKLSFEFVANDYNIEEVIDYINNSELYAFKVRVNPFISNEIYEDNNLNELGSDTKKVMKNFTDNTLEWMIEDKNEIKQIINGSEIQYIEADVTFWLGFELSMEGDNPSLIEGASHCTIKIYDGNYEWLTEDFVRSTDDEINSESGEVLSFVWEGNK